MSFITELELIGFKKMTATEDKQIQALLSECVIVPLNDNIKKAYVTLRKANHLKLTDAIIAATAMSLNIPLITSDKQFKTVTELSLVTYEP